MLDNLLNGPYLHPVLDKPKEKDISVLPMPHKKGYKAKRKAKRKAQKDARRVTRQKS
jgi:hypothetical protein